MNKTCTFLRLRSYIKVRLMGGAIKMENALSVLVTLGVLFLTKYWHGLLL